MKNDIAQVSLVIRSYIGAHAADAEVIPLSLSGTAQVQAQRFPLTAQAAFSEAGDVLRGSLEVAFTGQTALPASVSLEFSLKDWSREDYLLMPAAVYAGNRFCSVPLAYPPYAVMDPAEALDPPVTVTDIPRLSDTDARSRIQLLAGDLSTPAIGCFSPENRRALLLLTEHETAAGYTGLFFEEDLGTGCAVLRLSVPGGARGHAVCLCQQPVSLHRPRRHLPGGRADSSAVLPVRFSRRHGGRVVCASV